VNRRRRLLALALPAGVALAGAPLLVRAHQEHDGVPEKLALDKGKKWPTDEPLRDGMNKIRALLAPNAAAIQSLKLPPAECKQLGAAVQGQVAAITAQSKLPQDADVMLHVLVKNLLDGAEIMQGRGKVAPIDGAFKVLFTMNNYGNYFDHPGWKPLG
jgi:hypothetical protein